MVARLVLQDRAGGRAVSAWHETPLALEPWCRACSTPCAVQDIAKFLAGFAGEIDTSTFLEPVSSYKTFNEFFYRQLKPGARPIAEPDQPSVMVRHSACRRASVVCLLRLFSRRGYMVAACFVCAASGILGGRSSK